MLNSLLSSLGLHDLALFSFTVLVLNATPGVDMVFAVSRTLSGGARAGVAASLGISTGCAVHSLLAAFGLAAVLAVSHEQFIVFSSNAFAILGLRSLYFLLGGMQDKFRYLNLGLGAILAFVGAKMLAGYFLSWHPPTWLSLVVIVGVLFVTVVASLWADRRDDAAATRGSGPPAP